MGCLTIRKARWKSFSVTRTQRPVRSLSRDHWSWGKKNIILYISPNQLANPCDCFGQLLSQPFIVYMEDKDLFTNPCQLFSKLQWKRLRRTRSRDSFWKSRLTCWNVLTSMLRENFGFEVVSHLQSQSCLQLASHFFKFYSHLAKS